MDSSFPVYSEGFCFNADGLLQTLGFESTPVSFGENGSESVGFCLFSLLYNI